MAEHWYYAVGEERKGPVDLTLLTRLVRKGEVTSDTLVWKDGLPDWTAAGTFPVLFPARPAADPVASAPPPLPDDPTGAGRGLIAGVGARLSQVSDLPTISSMPVRDILVGGLQKKTGSEDIEEELIVGTRSTTPALADVQTGPPTPRIFWRILGSALATYALLYLGIRQFGNTNFIPGLMVIGSFVVPLSVVVLFFELNTPRNVSIYQVGKMVILGGALSLILTVSLFRFIPGSGVGSLLPALITGVIEETGKALTLLIVVGVARYRYQLNGLLFGAAVGAGFAGFESAGYAFRAALSSGLGAALDSILIRGLLAPGGHVIWTAMVGSALWRVKGDRPFRLSMLLHRDVVRRWGLAVVLHGLWDSYLWVHPYVQYFVLILVGWYLVFAILKQAFAEVEDIKAAATAPASP